MNTKAKSMEEMLDELDVPKLIDGLNSYVSSANAEFQIPRDMVILIMWHLFTSYLTSIQPSRAKKEDFAEWMKSVISFSVKDSGRKVFIRRRV